MFILHFSFDVVSVILRGESNCCPVKVYNLMAYANKAVVLALILFFFMYTLWYLYCLLCSFLLCHFMFLTCIHSRRTNQARLLAMCSEID